MESEIETYVMLLRHEMLAEDLKTVDKEYIMEIVVRAGGEASEVEKVLNHPSVGRTGNEYTVQGI